VKSGSVSANLPYRAASQKVSGGAFAVAPLGASLFYLCFLLKRDLGRDINLEKILRIPPKNHTSNLIASITAKIDKATAARPRMPYFIPIPTIMAKKTMTYGTE
jgi:hypothetical protein